MTTTELLTCERAGGLFVRWCLPLLVGGFCLASHAGGAEPPEPKPVDQLASVTALNASVDDYVKRIDDALSGDSYSAAKVAKVAKDANTLTVLFMALGLHEQEHPTRAAAPLLAELTQELVSAAEDQPQAREKFGKVKEMLAGGDAGDAPPLTWSKRFKMGILMKQVSTIRGRLKRDARKLADRQQAVEQQAALLAVIGQATIYDTHEVEDEAQLGDWYEMSELMRDAAADAGQAAQQGDAGRLKAAIKAIDDSCKKCHDVFHQE